MTDYPTVKPLGLVSFMAVKRVCGLQIVKNQSDINKEMVKTTLKHACVYQERKSSMHSGEWYSAPVNFLGLLCIRQTLEISWCEKCSCGFISSAGFWVRVLSCGFAFWGCLLFFPSLSNEKCKGRKFTSSSPQRVHTYTFSPCVCHHFLALSITAQINLLYHSLLRAWCTAWDLF